jgi:ATP-binding cassette subfamily C (CFTR/MRP) protein 1
MKSSTSIERLHEYSENNDLEKSFDAPEAPKGWPRFGGVDVKNISVRYRDGLQLVLKNVSFKVDSKDKVGIVGRTGSGKSTMLLA